MKGSVKMGFLSFMGKVIICFWILALIIGIGSLMIHGYLW